MTQAPGFLDVSADWKEKFYQTEVRVKANDQKTRQFVEKMEKSMNESPSGIRHYINVGCDEKTGEIYGLGLKYEASLLVEDRDVEYDRYDVFINAMYMYLKYTYQIYNSFRDKNIMCVPGLQRDFLRIAPYLMDQISNVEEVRALGKKYIENCVTSSDSYFDTTTSYFDYDSLVNQQNVCGEIFSDLLFVSTRITRGFTLGRYRKENKSLRQLTAMERIDFFNRVQSQSQQCSRTIYIPMSINVAETSHALMLLFDYKNENMPYSTLKIYDPNGSIDDSIELMSRNYTRDDDKSNLKEATTKALMYMANRLNADIVPMDVKCLNTRAIFGNTTMCFPKSGFTGYCSYLLKLTACLSLVANITYDDAFERIAMLDEKSLVYIVDTLIGMEISAEIESIVKTGRTLTRWLRRTEVSQNIRPELPTMRDVWKFVRKGIVER